MGYVRRCREAYETHRDGDRFVRCVLDGAMREARQINLDPREHDRDIVCRATKALVALAGPAGARVDREDIREHAGFRVYKGTGLWPWNRNNADVVVSQGRYRLIRPEFLGAMQRAVAGVTCFDEQPCLSGDKPNGNPPLR